MTTTTLKTKKTIGNYTLREFLSVFDFDYERKSNTIKLIDLQGANLGDIEEDTFHNRREIIDRLDIYYEDYIIEDIYDLGEENNLNPNFGWGNYVETLKWVRKHNKKHIYDYHIELLEIITGEKKLKNERR